MYCKGYMEVDNKISEESHNNITNILDKINSLSHVEKLDLYLQLPTVKGVTDSLKLPFNPLGSRFEIAQTVTWVRTHLKENPAVSLPKQDIYEEYKIYCGKNSMKPLSISDFGKVMKQVFPEVRARRLGTRGNSRYCYAGLCKMVHLPVPALPNLQKINQGTDESKCKMKEIVCTWMGAVMGKKFDSLSDMGRHLLSLENPQEQCSSAPSTVNLIKLKCTDQNSASRKIYEVESNSKVKHTITGKSGETVETNQKAENQDNNLSKIGNLVSRKRSFSTPLSKNIIIKKGKRYTRSDEKYTKGNSNAIKNKNINIASDNSLITANVSNCSKTNNVSYETNMDYVQNSNNDSNCSTVHAVTPEVNSITTVLHTGLKLPIPRLSQTCKNNSVATNLILLPAVVSPLPSTTGIYKPVQLSPSKKETVEQNNSLKTTIGQAFTALQSGSKENTSQVRVGCLEKDALNDYLYCDGNSQEEELIKYFQPKSTTVSNVEEINGQSQLRLLLENNNNTINKKNLTALKIQTNKHAKLPSAVVTNPSTVTELTMYQHDLKINKPKNIILPTLIFANSNLDTGKRAKFENYSVPQSPNTRRKLLNFTPISPIKSKAVSETQISPVKSRAVSETQILATSQTQDSKIIKLQTSKTGYLFRQSSPVVLTQITSPKAFVNSNRSCLKSPSSATAAMTTGSPRTPTEVSLSKDGETITSHILIRANANSSGGRRVSFGNSLVPQSLNIKRKLFHFAPISPTKTKSMGENEAISSHRANDSKNHDFQVSTKSNAIEQTSPNKLDQQSAITTKKSTLLSQDSILFSISQSRIPYSHVLPAVNTKSIEDSSTHQIKNLNNLPCSPVSCSELQKKVQSNSSTDSKATISVSQTPSLLQTILTHGTYKTEDASYNNTSKNNVPSKINVLDPLSHEVSKFFPEEEICTTSHAQTSYRSHSVPVVSSALTTQFIQNFQNTCDEFDSSLFTTTVSSEVTDFASITNVESPSSNFLILPEENNLETLDYDISKTQNNMFINSDMNKLFEIISSSSKGQLANSESEKIQQPSRSYPNTPIPYSRDPIISTFAPKYPATNHGSRSYPSTPVFSSQSITDNNITNSRSKNFNLNFSESTIIQGLLTKEEDDLTLELTGCEDTFNDLTDEPEEQL